MKTNLATLMSIINKEEANFEKLGTKIYSHAKNTSIIELNGTKTVIEDNKESFDKEMKELSETYEKLGKLKAVLYEKNNTFKLSDGRTIQTAIISNSYARKYKKDLEMIVGAKDTKKRYTEVNNSYFESSTINFDKEEIEAKIEKLDKEIEKTDFEISKLNSKEFTIELW